MYIPEHRQNRFAMRAVINYCVQEYKTFDKQTNRKLIGGVNCDGANSFREFMATKKIYGKDNGFFFYHYAQSFSPKEKITPEQAHEIALEFALSQEKSCDSHRQRSNSCENSATKSVSLMGFLCSNRTKAAEIVCLPESTAHGYGVTVGKKNW